MASRKRRGKRKRSRPTGAPLVVMVLPELDSIELERRSGLCGAESHRRGFGDPKVYRAKRSRITGAPERTVELVDPLEAAELYGQLHRLRVLVLAFGPVLIRRNPARDPVAKRDAIGLGCFVHDKAVFRLLRGDPDVNLAFDAFDAWRGSTECTGEDDARVLPFHVFTSAADRRSLGTQQGQDAFAQRHGTASHRKDDAGRSWDRAKRSEYHGGEVVCIAGCDLDRGMHWDVSGKRATLYTTHEIWKLEGRHPYVNVYPNAVVARRGFSTSRKSWDWGQRVLK